MEFRELLIDLIIILVAARMGGELMERLGQTAVLGELLAGVVIGPGALGLVHETKVLHAFAELGLIILLFEVGLESDLAKLLQAGPQALLVAVVDIIVPFTAGFGLMQALGHSGLVAVFVGATLTATSVGVTARVLTDLGQLQDPAASVVLGAAVIDDILGLITLAVVTGIAATGSVSLGGVALLAVKSAVFLVIAVLIALRRAPVLMGLIGRLQARGALVVSALVFALVLALAAEWIGLAAIIGAFAAGLILTRTEPQAQIEARIKPVADLLVPIFFVLVGMKVAPTQLNPFAEGGHLWVALALTVIAIASKLTAGLAVYHPGTRRWPVGVGMVPRGEVGLIFAGAGLAAAVVALDLYSALVVVVMITTFVAPAWLKALYRPDAPPHRTDPDDQGDRGIEMNLSRLTRRPEAPLKACLAGIAVLTLVAGCDRGDAKASKQGSAAPILTVLVAEVPQRTVQVGADFVARTEGVPTVEIRARVSGVLDQVRFREGSEVKQGQVLFMIQPEEYKAALQSARAQQAKAEADLLRAKDTSIVDRARASLDQAKADLGKDRADVARYRPLVEQQAIPKQDLDTALSREQASAAGVAAAEAALKDSILVQRTAIQLAEAAVESGKASVTQAELNVKYTVVESPINGIISKLAVDTGNLVGKGEPTLLATVSAVDPIYADFAITEADYLRLVKRIPGLGRGEVPRDQPATFDLILSDGSVFPQKGRPVFVDRAVDQKTGTIQVRAAFPNPQRVLRPGQFARVRAVTEEVPDAILVPQVAVQDLQGAKTVMVVGEDGKVAMRTLTLRQPYQDFYIVTAGIKPGERVIVEGIQKVRPGLVVKAELKPAADAKPAPAQAAPAPPASAPPPPPASKPKSGS